MDSDKQIEAVARRLCELRGIDPSADERVPKGHPLDVHTLPGCVQSASNWELLAHEARAWLELYQAASDVSAIAHDEAGMEKHGGPAGPL